jgi:hypothetical protein
MRLFLLFSLIIQTYSFYLKAGPGHNTEHAEILTDPIHGSYHLFLLYKGHHICSIGAKDSEILFVDNVCKEATITVGEHWLFSIDHRNRPYGTITVKLLLSDGSTLSEEILGHCPGTNYAGRCIQKLHTSGQTGIKGHGGENTGSAFPYIAGFFVFVTFVVIYIYS